MGSEDDGYEDQELTTMLESLEWNKPRPTSWTRMVSAPALERRFEQPRWAAPPLKVPAPLSSGRSNNNSSVQITIAPSAGLACLPEIASVTTVVPHSVRTIVADKGSRLLLDVGERMAGYEVEAFVARGGMAVVYRARDVALGKPWRSK